MPLAEVNLSCGRYNLTVAGIVLAMEGDKCRDGDMPNEVYDPIPEEELATATIGGKPVNDMPEELVRFFRGSHWNLLMLRYAADKINEATKKEN